MGPCALQAARRHSAQADRVGHRAGARRGQGHRPTPAAARPVQICRRGECTRGEARELGGRVRGEDRAARAARQWAAGGGHHRGQQGDQLLDEVARPGEQNQIFRHARLRYRRAPRAAPHLHHAPEGVPGQEVPRIRPTSAQARGRRRRDEQLRKVPAVPEPDRHEPHRQAQSGRPATPKQRVPGVSLGMTFRGAWGAGSRFHSRAHYRWPHHHSRLVTSPLASAEPPPPSGGGTDGRDIVIRHDR
mmetsp:Transcript_19520/g.65546  ORF Transcript_19520/g.65546 Transcript_19520/m.65546 type:complete len:246 (+) Transcript_19520:1121-1858(+)